MKHFLVDSENVNDNWLLLLDMSDEADEITVFYTKNSPHMSYTSVVRLLQTGRHISFEECHEGNNALDFQLVTYLGYQLGQDPAEDSEFIIMSNDTGFDAAVNFWKERNFKVNRINVNYCKLFLARKKKKEAESFTQNEVTVNAEDNAEVNFEADAEDNSEALPSENVTADSTEDFSENETTDPAEVLSPEVDTAIPDLLPQITVVGQQQITAVEQQQTTVADQQLDAADRQQPAAADQLPSVPADAEEKETVAMSEASPSSADLTKDETAFDFNRNEVDLFINCIGRDNLTDIHETLVHVYGQQQGQNIYKVVKAKSYPLIEKQYRRKEKVENYARMIFYHSSLNVPDNFVDFLEKNKDKTRNLNGIRSAIVKVYGNDSGMKYYSLFKPYFKIISALK